MLFIEAIVYEYTLSLHQVESPKHVFFQNYHLISNPFRYTELC